MSDVHLYLTAPFVLSWSLFNALACGAVVVASDTAPVRELIEHGQNGLMADFFDVDGLANLALGVLREPHGHRHLGEAAAAMIEERYALRVTLPRILELYARIAPG
jgi:glycosyltransferase involved in cell wall biosynthesis